MKETTQMNRSTLFTSVAACLCLGLPAPVLAAETPATAAVNNPPAADKTVSASKPAEKCLSDLQAFDTQMEKDGYWLGGSGYGFGYPMGGYGYSYPERGYSPMTTSGYQTGRPGYEVRMLLASANILAQHGQQQPCEDVLATSRDSYKLYLSGMQSRRVATMDLSGWRQQQIAAAQPVTDQNVSFRSDELLGTDVRTPQNVALGSVDDLVISPQTGKITYLVIARGGIFGIDQKYFPVPWEDFKITPNVNLLVLDSTQNVLDAAPQVDHDRFATDGNFDQESQKIDAYWKSKLSN
jgi:sporulation protein YlmC with PRC-barrel domain